MRRCSSKPYEGEKQYIFVSYCHKDRAFVYPIVERLAQDGYRVWYDEGIDPGSEWPEIIARHLNNSAACIAFLSENALNSHNCRREINFALLKKKPFISVVLEQVSMSLGMEMQLSATQAIFKYTLTSEEEFFKKLYSAQLLKPCLGEPNPDVVVSTPEDYAEDVEGIFSETCLKRDSFSDKWFVGVGQESTWQNPPADDAPPEELAGDDPAGEAEEDPAEEPDEAHEEEPEEEAAERPEEVPAMAPAEVCAEEPAEEFPVEASEVKEKAESAQPEEKPAEDSESAEDLSEETDDAGQPGPISPQLVRVKTGEVIPLPEGMFKLGRSTSNHYVVSGNSMIGRWHAMIAVRGSQCSLIDNHSMNRTFLNQQVLEPEKEYPLQDGDSICMANEKFVFHLREAN